MKILRPQTSPAACPAVKPEILWYDDEDTGVRLVVSEHLAASALLPSCSALDLAVLACCDGASTAAGIAATLELPETVVSGALERWQRRAPSLFVWLAAPGERVAHDRHRAAAKRLLREWQAAREGAAPLGSYHRFGIAAAEPQFDRVETTVSHAFSRPHAALAGRTYGQAFADRLLATGALREGTRVLEIGGGTGLFAQHLLARVGERAPEVLSTLRYTVLDLAPPLLLSLRRRCRSSRERLRFVLADVERAPLAPASFDLVIANEMIADLAVAPGELQRAAAGEAATPGEALVQRYGLSLSNAQPRFVVNQGAIRLVESLARWLAPKGQAILTEYGSTELFPQAVDLEGHREHSIHFGHLTTVATALGMAPQLGTLGPFLGADGRCEVIDRRSFHMLSRYLLPALGRPPLPALAYDRESLHGALGGEAGRIGNLRFVPLAEGGFMSPFGFFTLHLRAPETAVV